MNVLELVTKNLEGNKSEVVVTVKVNEPNYLNYYVKEVGDTFEAINGIGLHIKDIKNDKDTTKIVSKDTLAMLKKAVDEFNECANCEDGDMIPVEEFKTKSIDEKLNIIYELLYNSTVLDNPYLDDLYDGEYDEDDKDTDCYGDCDSCEGCDCY